MAPLWSTTYSSPGSSFPNADGLTQPPEMEQPCWCDYVVTGSVVPAFAQFPLA